MATTGAERGVARTARGILVLPNAANIPNAINLAKGLGAIVALLAFHYALNDYLFHRLMWPAIHEALAIDEGFLASNPWVGLYTGHGWALVTTLGAIYLLGDSGWRGWSGLTLKNLRASMSLSWPASAAYAAILLAFFGLLYLLPHQSPAFAYPLTTLNIAGWLSFEWLFAGTVEEIKYRGLFQAFVGRYWTGSLRIRGFELPFGGIAAAVLFALAHVQFSYVPFGVASVNVPQVALWFVLALWFSTVRQRTGSLVGPIVMHNLNNGFAQCLLFGLAFVLGS